MENKKLYITKWALTAGIIEVESNILTFHLEADSYWRGKYHKDATTMIFYVEKDITDNLDHAKMIANIMRLKKIESLQKQIKKLESKTF